MSQIIHALDAMQVARLVASRRFIIQVVIYSALILGATAYIGAKVDNSVEAQRALAKELAKGAEAEEKLDAVRHEAIQREIHDAKKAVDTLAAWYQNDYRIRAPLPESEKTGGRDER